MILCVVLPYFVASIEQRHHALAADQPVILRDGIRVAGISQAAAAVDLTKGMTVRHALAQVPEAEVLPLHPPRYRAEQERIDTLLNDYSEVVELLYSGWGNGDSRIPLSEQAARSSRNPAVWFLDIGTLKPRDLYGFVGRLYAQLKSYAPLLGVAANRFTAWVTALMADERGFLIVPPGEEAWSIYCYSVSFLPLDAKALQRLWRLGVQTLGAYAALPSAGIGLRFGKQGQIAHQLAKGIDSTPVRSRIKLSGINHALQFENGLEDRQLIETALAEVAGKLQKRLEARSETIRSVRLTLLLNDGSAQEYETRLRRRTQVLAHLLQALNALLDKARINAAVTGLEVLLSDIARSASAQLELFPSLRASAARQEAMDDMIARYGNCFYQPAIVDPWSPMPRFQGGFHTLEMS